jgi:hypothetical protein
VEVVQTNRERPKATSGGVIDRVCNCRRDPHLKTLRGIHGVDRHVILGYARLENSADLRIDLAGLAQASARAALCAIDYEESQQK